jgi:hypothetical protein
MFIKVIIRIISSQRLRATKSSRHFRSSTWLKIPTFQRPSLLERSLMFNQLIATISVLITREDFTNQRQHDETRKCRGKAIPVAGRGGPQGYWEFEALICSTQWVHSWRWGCQPYKPAALYCPGKLFFCFWYSFLLQAEQPPGPRAAEELGKLKQSNYPNFFNSFISNQNYFRFYKLIC